MVTLPGDTAVTTPLSSTVAIFSLLEEKVTTLQVLLGKTISYWPVPPTFSEAEEGLRETLSGRLYTLTLQVSFRPLAVVAVILQEPVPTAVTTPLASTVATFLSLDFHATVEAHSVSPLGTVRCGTRPL